MSVEAGDGTNGIPHEDEGRLPGEVRRALGEHRSRARRFAVARGVGLTLTVYIGIVIAMALLDRFLMVPVWLRATLSFGSMGGMIAFAYYAFVAPVLRRPGARETAFDLERGAPEFNEALLTTVDHLATGRMRRGSSAALLGEVARGAGAVAGGLDASRVLPAKVLKRTLIVAAVAVAVFAGLFVIPGLGFARLVVRFHAPLANLPRVSLLGLSVEPGSAVVGTGDPVAISALLSEPFDGAVVLHVRPEREPWAKSEMPESAKPPRARTSFIRKIGSVTSTFDYYVTAGSAESAVYRVLAVARPLPEVFRVTYAPPAYTGAAAVTEEGPTGSVRGLKGSHVTLGVRPSVPVKGASLARDGHSIPMEISEEGMLASAEFDLEKDGSYSLRLEGDHGLANNDGREYPITVLADAPPTVGAALVRATSPASVDRRAARHGIGPESALCIRYEAKDDWGVEGARSWVSLGGREPVVRKLPLVRPARSIAKDFLVDLASLGAKRGDHVSIVVSARDSLGQLGRSRTIAIWLGRDVAARVAGERAKRIRAAAEAVREMEKLREALEDEKAALADLMKKDGWSPERERKLAEVRRLARSLQSKAEQAREELRSARELADDDLARALSVASRKLSRERSESERLDEMLARLDAADQASRDRAAEKLVPPSGKPPEDGRLSESLETIATGERASAVLERDGALAERKGRLEEIARAPLTPAREEFVKREEALMEREGRELAQGAEELGIEIETPQWKDEARELAEKGKRAAEELLDQDDVAGELAALAKEASKVALARPEDAERGLEAVRGEMEGLEAQLAQAARDETALERPDYALARDEDLTRAALEGMERRNVAEATEEERAPGAAKRLAGELGEAAAARETLEEAARERRKELGAPEAAEREAEAARDTLARLAGDPAEALERLAAREEAVANDAAQASRRSDEGAASRDELAQMAETQAHLAEEAERLAERLMHEANAETAAAQPDVERAAALDELRNDIEDLARDEMKAATEALQEAAAGEPRAAEEAGRQGQEAAKELGRLAAEARKMAGEQAAAEPGQQGQPPPQAAAEPGQQGQPPPQAPGDPALAELGQVADLEAAQQELAERTQASDASNNAEGQQLSREQQALGERTREAMEAMRARDAQMGASRDAAAAAAERAEELAQAAEMLSRELTLPGRPAQAAAEPANVAQAAEALAETVGRAEAAAREALPQAAPQMQAAAESTAQAAEQAQAGSQSAEQGQGQPAAGQFAQAAENLEQAADDLGQAAAAAEQALAPQAGAAMQTAAGQQDAAAGALASEEQQARAEAHQSQLAAAEALSQARQELAASVNSARTEQAAAGRPEPSPQPGAPGSPAQSQAMRPSGTPGGSLSEQAGRVVGEAPAKDGSDWGRLRENEDGSKSAPAEGITVHYAEAIRLYFEAVAREAKRE